MNRRDFFGQIAGGSAIHACNAVHVTDSRPLALLEAAPCCPECGLMVEIIARPASPTWDSEVRCSCGWIGITQRFIPPARGC